MQNKNGKKIGTGEQDPRTITLMRKRLKVIQEQMDLITSEVGIPDLLRGIAEKKVITKGVKRAEQARKKSK